jgi:hypothetical protein
MAMNGIMVNIMRKSENAKLTTKRFEGVRKPGVVRNLNKTRNLSGITMALA